MSGVMALNDLLKGRAEGFSDDCSVQACDFNELQERLACDRVRIRRAGGLEQIHGVQLVFDGLPDVHLTLCGSRTEVAFGDQVKGRFSVTAYADSRLSVGSFTTANGVRLFLSQCDVLIGQDCMLSDDILLQGSDQHGIVDLSRGCIINQTRKTMVLESHVWLGRSASVMPGAHIGHGSIIGACSVVTSRIPACSLAVGIPARVIKGEVSWSRHNDRIDSRSARFFEQWAQDREVRSPES